MTLADSLMDDLHNPGGKPKSLLEQMQEAIINVELHLEEQVAVEVAKILGTAPADLDTLGEVSTELANLKSHIEDLEATLASHGVQHEHLDFLILE